METFILILFLRASDETGAGLVDIEMQEIRSGEACQEAGEEISSMNSQVSFLCVPG